MEFLQVANPKLLLTFGSDSSISDPTNKSWVDYLADHIKIQESLHFAIPNIGNDEIARKVIYEVSQILKSEKYDCSELLVGIMWEDLSRIVDFTTDKKKCTIVNYEHFLRVQWFLERFGIKFFMCRSHPSAKISEKDEKIINDYYVFFLNHGIDYTYWISSNSLYIHSQNKRISVDKDTKKVSTEGHLDFTNLIIEQLKILDFIK